jgi:hypothetical protein
MKRFLIFTSLSILTIYFFRKKIARTESPDFFYFLYWECFAWIVSYFSIQWLMFFWSVRSVFSWGLLAVSLYVTSTFLFQKLIQRQTRSETFESYLLKRNGSGSMLNRMYSKVRFPENFALICLLWSLFLRNVRFDLFLITVFGCYFVVKASQLRDQKRAVRYEGRYQAYQQSTKLVLPFVL